MINIDPTQQIKVASLIPNNPMLQKKTKTTDNGMLQIAPITEQIICNFILPNPFDTFTYIEPKV